MSAEQKERERFDRPVVVTLLSVPELQNDLESSLSPYIDIFSPSITERRDIERFFSEHPKLHPRIEFMLVDQFNLHREFRIETTKWINEIRKSNPGVKIVECSFMPSPPVYDEQLSVVHSFDLFYLTDKLAVMLGGMKSTPGFVLNSIETWTHPAFLEAQKLNVKPVLLQEDNFLNETQTRLGINNLFSKLLELIVFSSDLYFDQVGHLIETDKIEALHLSWIIIFQISHSGIESIDQLKLSRLKELLVKAEEKYKTDRNKT